MTQILPYIKHLKPYIRQLRNNMTPAEKRLWYKIRCKKLHGIQFCRQMPIESYIVDFYSKAPKIAIEVDGPIHLEAQATGNDINRDYVLKTLGVTVLRFTNDQIFNDIHSVIESIKRAILKNRPF
jgi:very-short-patch-repair endonuclease